MENVGCCDRTSARPATPIETIDANDRLLQLPSTVKDLVGRQFLYGNLLAPFPGGIDLLQISV